MLRYLYFTILTILLISCATNQKKLELARLKKKVCLNMDGKMRLEADGQKYVTDLSIKSTKESTLVGVNIPLFGEYLIELVYNKRGKLIKTRGIKNLLKSLKSEITESQVKYEQKRLIGVLSLWKKLHTSLNNEKSDEKHAYFSWEKGPNDNELIGTVRKGKYKNKLMVHFLNLDKYFTRQTIYYSPEKTFQSKLLNKVKIQGQNGMILEAFVRECLDELT